MDLPPPLRVALDALLAGRRAADLGEAGRRLSARYQPELRDGRLHVSDEETALAYLATRLPATFAALAAAFGRAAERLPDLAPRPLLDVGAGPGTATWAAATCWPSLADAALVEASASMRRAGEALLRPLPVTARWVAGDAAALARDLPQADVVVLGYVLGELEPAAAARLVAGLWERRPALLVVVDPGTPAGWRRMLAMRRLLLAAGAHVVAPCPHAEPCPIGEPDWCHFSARLARSRLHRLAKGAERPFEDEPYTYLAVAAAPPPPVPARVLSAPRTGSGKVALKLCRADGSLAHRTVTRREGERFREARRLDWGDATGV